MAEKPVQASMYCGTIVANISFLLGVLNQNDPAAELFSTELAKANIEAEICAGCVANPKSPSNSVDLTCDGPFGQMGDEIHDDKKIFHHANAQLISSHPIKPKILQKQINCHPKLINI